MADYEIDRLNIGVDVDDGQASRDITKVTEEVQNLGDAISNLPESHALQNLGEEAEGASSKLKDVAESVENVKRAIGIEEALDFARSTSQVETLDMKLTGLGARLADVLEQDEPNLSSMASLIQQIQSTDKKMEKLNETARDSAVEEVGEHAEATASAMTSMNDAIEKAGESLRHEEESAERTTTSVNDLVTATEKASVLDMAKSASQFDIIEMKIDGLTTKLATLYRDPNYDKGVASGLIKQIQKLQAEYDKLPQSTSLVVAKDWNEAQAKASEYTQVLRDAVSASENVARPTVTTEMASQLAQATTKTDLLRAKLDEATESLRKLMEEGASGQKLNSAISRVQSAQSALNKELEKAEPASKLASEATNKVTFSLSDLRKQIDGLKKNPLSKVFKFFGAPFIAPFNSASKALKDIRKRVDGLGARLKRVALYRAMREGIHMVTEGIKEGINNAYEWARIMGNEFAGSMDSLATSSLYLKNSLGALAMPLINIVAPAVEKVIDLFVLLLNTVNKLLARIGGRATWVKAVRYPTSYGEALDDATGSAKALEKELITILGIDEINPMEGANDSGRGSGSGGADAMDYSSMFEEVELEADALDDFLEKMFDPFVKAWETKGKGVTKAFDNALGGLKSTAEAVGTSFWTVWTNGTGQESIEHILGILTGILNTIGNIGAKFAEGWNTDNLGTDTIQNLWDALNDILEMWEEIANATADWAEGLDFEPLIRSIKGFTDELEPLVDLITDGLAWAWTNVLLPLGKWTIEEGLPATIDLLTEAFRLLKNLLEIAQPHFEKLWNDFLKPLGGLLLGIVIDELKQFKDVLKDINDAIEGNKSWGEVIGGLLAKLTELVRVASHAGAGLRALFKGDFATGLNELAIARAILLEMGQTVEEVEQTIADPLSEHGIKIAITDIEDKIPVAKKQEGIKGLTGWLTGEPKKESGFISKIGGFLAGLTGTPTKEKGFNPNIGGMTAQLGKTDTTKLSTASKTIASIANFQSLQTNWNSSVKTSGKSPIWGAKANFTTLQTNWNSSISTSGKAVMWGAKANFTALQTNWNSGIQTDPSDKKKPRWGALANFTNLVTGWKSGSTTWDAVANFWKALTGWANDYLTWDAFAKFVDWETTFGKPTIKANIQADKILTKGGATLELKALGGAFYGGKWHDIPQYASGTLNAGSMFIAGEAGAELVGHIGGRTEVLNQSQLASTMYASVASANANQNRLLQEQNNLLRELINKQGNMRAYITSGDVVEGLTQRNRRDGRTVVAVGG